MVPVTAKNVTIKVHSHVEQIKELTLATHDGQPDVIKADKNVNYEFFDHSIGRAPNHIIAKRKGKDLHVSFEREGQNDDLIIEGFFEDEDKALIGVAEDGHYYYYIPDTGEVADYVTQLQDADVEGQALGGEHHLTPLWLMLPTGTFPWWPLLGLGVIPFLGKDDDDKPAPAPDSVISTTNDSERGDADNPVRVNVLKNDADNAVPETLRLIDPKTGRPTTEKVVVSGQGTWELDPKEPGVVIFTPEKGYNGNPTPINYVVKNKEGKESQPTPVFIIYDASTTPDTKP
ncbi:Ig-like domain-containing protein, partial [Moraxella bovis]